MADIERTCEDGGERACSRSAALPLSLMVAAFALLVASLWVSIGDTSVYSPASIPSRALFIATCLAVAWAFRSHVPSVRVIAWAGTLLSMAGIALHFIGLYAVLDAGVGSVVAVVGLICGKTASALLFLLAIQLAGSFDRKTCTVGIPLGFLLAELIFCLCSYVLPSWCLVAAQYSSRPAASVLMLVCVYVCLGKRPVRGMTPIQRGFSGAQGRTVLFLENDMEWMLLLLGTTLFPLLFSVAAQLCLVGGGTGLYDPPNEMAAACCFLLLAIYGALTSTHMTYGRTLSLCVPLLALGFALLPWFGGTNGLAGQVFIKMGFFTYQTMFWVLLVCKVHDDPRRCYLYGGLFLGLFMFAKTLGRSIAFTPEPGVQEALLSWQVAVAALFVICLYTLAFFVVASRPKAANAPGGADARDEGAQRGELAGLAGDASATDLPAEPADPFVLKLDGFCGAYHVTPREREVMELAVHGYTMSAIGKSLYITEDTVKTHLRRVYAKAGVASKQGLIAAVEGFMPGVAVAARTSSPAPAEAGGGSCLSEAF